MNPSVSVRIENIVHYLVHLENEKKAIFYQRTLIANYEAVVAKKGRSSFVKKMKIVKLKLWSLSLVRFETVRVHFAFLVSFFLSFYFYFSPR